jgi:hypothetical protein
MPPRKTVETAFGAVSLSPRPRQTTNHPPAAIAPALASATAPRGASGRRLRMLSSASGAPRRRRSCPGPAKAPGGQLGVGQGKLRYGLIIPAAEESILTGKCQGQTQKRNSGARQRRLVRSHRQLPLSYPSSPSALARRRAGGGDPLSPARGALSAASLAQGKSAKRT